MEINIRKDGILEIDDARIIFRNFSGAADKYNREGDRNFAVIIPDQEMAEELLAEGWNVKIKQPSEGYEDDGAFIYLSVAVNFNERGPGIYLESGNNVQRLNEETVGMLDDIEIISVDMDIRPYDWEVNGKTGRKAYLQSMSVRHKVNRIDSRYMFDNDSEENPED